MDSLMQTDLYELLQVEVGADEKEIKSAYRKKALTCHPDKNPDNPRAAELFQQLSRALEVLTDPAARSAYDAVLKARQAAKIRHQGLDAKRRKLREELEAREAGPGQEAGSALRAQQRLKQEVERLRREGSRQLAEQRELLQRQVQQQQQQQQQRQQGDGGLARLKVRWKQQPGLRGYTEDTLRQRLSQYGSISCLVVRNGSALVEFEEPSAARLASQLEQGSPDEGPLTVRLVGGTELTQPHPPPPSRTATDDDDYESLVLRKLQQAASSS